jgi:hypothetical protein
MLCCITLNFRWNSTVSNPVLSECSEKSDDYLDVAFVERQTTVKKNSRILS